MEHFKILNKEAEEKNNFRSHQFLHLMSPTRKQVALQVTKHNIK